MNAAGWFNKNSVHTIQQLGNSALTTTLMGSYVPDPRLGNKKAEGHRGDLFYVDQTTGEGINAMNLPDSWGREGLMIALPEMVGVAHLLGKKLRISVAGFTPADFADFIQAFYRLPDRHRPDEIELNFGCPNAHGHGIISYHFPTFQESICAVLTSMPQRGCISTDVKVSPMMAAPAATADKRDLYRQIALSLPPYGEGDRCIRAIVTSNTLPNQQMFDIEGNSRIAAIVQDGPSKGTLVERGGMSGGDRMLLMLCEEARNWNQHLPEDVGLVLVGGISRAEHVRDAVRAGGGTTRVLGVQVGTALFAAPLDAGKRILHEVGVGMATWFPEDE